MLFLTQPSHDVGLLFQAGKDLRGKPSGRAILSPCTPEGSMELPWKGRSEVTVGGCLEGAATYGSPSPSLSRPGGAARIARIAGPQCRPSRAGGPGEAPPYATAREGPLHTVNPLLPLPGQAWAPCLGAQARIRRKSAQSIPCTKRASWKDEVPVLNCIWKACVS